MRYKRILLEKLTNFSSIERLDWRPESDYQMILGSNGSGKSTLMREISPCPAISKRYGKGGLKHIELEHNHVDYVLISTMNSGTGKHSFVRDGVELNVGGTLSIQRDLVMEHLKYNDWIHDILIGHPTAWITRADKSTRQKIMAMCDSCDYTYLFEFYNRIKRQKNDLDGAIRISRKRLAEETQALAQLSDAEGIEERVEALQRGLSELLSARMSQAPRVDVTLGLLKRDLSEAESISESIIRTSDRLGVSDVERSVEDMDETLTRLRAEESHYSGTLRRIGDEYHRHELAIAELGDNADTSTEEFDTQIQNVSSEISQLSEGMVSYQGLVGSADTATIVNTLAHVIPELQGIFAELPDNTDRRLTMAKYDELGRARNEEANRIENLRNSMTAIKGRLEHIRHSPMVECPSCSNKWSPDVKHGEEKHLLDQLEKAESLLAKLLAAKEGVDAYRREVEAYRDLWHRWQRFQGSYPTYRLLWNAIKDIRADVHTPSENTHLFMEFAREAKLAARINEMSDMRQRLIRQREASLMGTAKHHREEMARLEKDIHETQVTLKGIREAISTASLSLSLFKELKVNESKLEETLNSVSERYQTLLMATAAECIEKDIRSDQAALGALMHTHNSKRALLTVIDDITKSLDRHQEEQAVLEVLMRHTSPTEGLIADLMLRFIGFFVEQMNSLIESVWAYDLKVLPCDMGDGELTYKFPYLRGVDPTPVSDIGESSTSIEDIFNFAFRQAFALYMSDGEYPLFVDELGASFDEKHRQKVHAFVSQLMDSKRYSQVFMISHYAAGWASYSGAEYLVIDSRNITAPEPNNTHAIIS